MKEAEAIAISVVYGLTPATTDKQEVIDLTEEIKAYGKQCAEQALKDAAENAKLHIARMPMGEGQIKVAYTDYSGINSVTVFKQSILSTPIVTP